MRDEASAFAAPLGIHRSCFAAEFTRARMSEDTLSGEFSARETDAVDTRASVATSARVTVDDVCFLARFCEGEDLLVRFILSSSI